VVDKRAEDEEERERDRGSVVNDPEEDAADKFPLGSSASTSMHSSFSGVLPAPDRSPKDDEKSMTRKGLRSQPRGQSIAAKPMAFLGAHATLKVYKRRHQIAIKPPDMGAE
jgi:hypothetical protein